MIQLKIKVTKEILERSKMCNSADYGVGTNCAVAFAVRDIFPNAYVESHAIYIGATAHGQLMDDTIIIKLPKKVGKFIDIFDLSEPEERILMQPIEFEISIPDEVLEKINIDEVRQLLVNHPTLELV